RLRRVHAETLDAYRATTQLLTMPRLLGTGQHRIDYRHVNLQCPVLAIAERNRAKMSVGGLDASAGSRRFEYGAESVLALNREKDEGADGEAKITLTRVTTSFREICTVGRLRGR